MIWVDECINAVALQSHLNFFAKSCQS